MLHAKNTFFLTCLSLVAVLALHEAAPVPARGKPALEFSSVPEAEAEAEAARQVTEPVDEAVENLRDRADRIFSRYGDIIFGVMIPVGLIFALAGYKLLKPTVFLAGFFIGGFVVSTIVYELTKNNSAGAWAPTLSFIIGGATIGLIAVFFINFGFFAAGAALGIILAFILRSLFATISNSTSEWAFYVFVAVMGLIFGILAVVLKKPVVITATAFGGSFGFVYGIARFAGDFLTPNEFFADDREEIGWESWAIFAGWLVLGFVGIFVQYRYTANKNKKGKRKDEESYNATLKAGVPQTA